MSKKQKAQPNNEEIQKTPEQIDQEFMVEYDRLCKRYKRVIAVQPQFKYRDDNTYSIVVVNFVRRAN